MWNQGNSSRWQVKVGYVFGSGFLATSVQEEEIKREVETIKKPLKKSYVFSNTIYLSSFVEYRKGYYNKVSIIKRAKKILL